MTPNQKRQPRLYYYVALSTFKTRPIMLHKTMWKLTLPNYHNPPILQKVNTTWNSTGLVWAPDNLGIVYALWVARRIRPSPVTFSYLIGDSSQFYRNQIPLDLGGPPSEFNPFENENWRGLCGQSVLSVTVSIWTPLESLHWKIAKCPFENNGTNKPLPPAGTESEKETFKEAEKD